MIQRRFEHIQSTPYLSKQVSGNKTFLSKTYAKDIEPNDLYIGGTIVL